MMLMVEAQLEGIKSHEWEEILKPTSTYIGDGEEKLKEIIERLRGMSPLYEDFVKHQK